MDRPFTIVKVGREGFKVARIQYRFLYGNMAFDSIRVPESIVPQFEQTFEDVLVLPETEDETE